MTVLARLIKLVLQSTSLDLVAAVQLLISLHKTSIVTWITSALERELLPISLLLAVKRTRLCVVVMIKNIVTHVKLMLLVSLLNMVVLVLELVLPILMTTRSIVIKTTTVGELDIWTASLTPALQVTTLSVVAMEKPMVTHAGLTTLVFL